MVQTITVMEYFRNYSVLALSLPLRKLSPNGWQDVWCAVLTSNSETTANLQCIVDHMEKDFVFGEHGTWWITKVLPSWISTQNFLLELMFRLYQSRKKMVLTMFTHVTHSFKFEPKKRYSKCFTGPADPPHFFTQFLPASHFYPFLRYFISHNQNYSVPAQHAVMSQIINKNIPHFPILPYSPTRNHVLLIPFLVEYTLLTGIYQNPIA